MKRILMLSGLVVLLLPIGANADQILPLYVNVTTGPSVTINVGGITERAAAIRGIVGILDDAAEDSGRLEVLDTFPAFCVDIFHYISYGYTYFGDFVHKDGQFWGSAPILGEVWSDDMSDWGSGGYPSPNYPLYYPPISPNAGRVASWLYNQYAYQYLNDTNWGGALQIAIWEVLYERNTSYNVSNGNIYFTNVGGTGVLNRSQWFLNSIPLIGMPTTFGDPDTDMWNAMWLRTPPLGDPQPYTFYQDWMIHYDQPVPEPASLLLLGAGLVGLAIVARRKNR